MSARLAIQSFDLKPVFSGPPNIAALQLVTLPPDQDTRARDALTEQEKARVDRIKSEPRRVALQQTLAARRLWLARHLSVGSNDVLLEYDANGMPLLAGFAPGEMSFSRSEAWCAIALAKGRRVGVDLETERDMNWSSVLDFLSIPAEADRIRAEVNASGTLTPFFRAWCIKEAVLKLTGKGLKAGPKLLKLPETAVQGASMFSFTTAFGLVDVYVAQFERKVVALATAAL